MKVLLTGACGRLGRAAWRVLLDAGMDVVATDLRFRGDAPGKAIVADLLDPTQCYRLLDGCDTVVHLANHPNIQAGPMPQRLYQENVGMNANVFQAAVEMGVKTLIYASSIQACMPIDASDNTAPMPPYLPIDGNLPVNPSNLYGLSKAAGEQMLRYYHHNDASLCCVAIRFPHIWPAVGDPRIRQWLDASRERVGPTTHHITEGLSLLPSDDAGRLVAAILQHPLPGYHQLLPASAINLVQMTADEAIRRYYPGVELRRPLDQIDALIDCSYITERWGWVPADPLAPALNGALQGTSQG